MSDDHEAEVAAARLEALRAFEIVLQDPHALLDVVLASRDNDDAYDKIAARYGVSREAATAVMTLQFSRITGQGRDWIADELRSMLARGDGTG